MGRCLLAIRSADGDQAWPILSSMRSKTIDTVSDLDRSAIRASALERFSTATVVSKYVALNRSVLTEGRRGPLARGGGRARSLE